MSYVTEVADSIISHCGTRAILGPEIYTAIAEWEKKEIPVAILLISIEEICRTGNSRCDEMIPLTKFQEAVSRNFRIWLAHTVGV